MRKLRNLNLNALTVIESVHRLGSFTRAAEEMNITPSAVSQRIKTFEDQLGYALFERRSHPVTTTPQGAEFVTHCREALDTILAAGALHENDARDRVLKISVLPTFAIRWLMPRLKKFETESRGVRLHISQGYEAVNFRKVDMDVAVRYGNGHFPGLDATLLMRENLVPTLSPQLLAENFSGPDDAFTAADLVNFNLLHSGTCHLYWRSWLSTVGEPQVLHSAKSMSFDSCVLTLQAASMGVGVALANLAYIVDDIASGALIAPLQSIASTHNGWYLVYPPGHRRLEKVQIFKDWICGEAKAASEQMPDQNSFPQSLAEEG